MSVYLEATLSKAIYDETRQVLNANFLLNNIKMGLFVAAHVWWRGGGGGKKAPPPKICHKILKSYEDET